jgi:hypothetical protein
VKATAFTVKRARMGTAAALAASTSSISRAPESRRKRGAILVGPFHYYYAGSIQ